jgi:hypothetical protein
LRKCRDERFIIHHFATRDVDEAPLVSSAQTRRRTCRAFRSSAAHRWRSRHCGKQRGEIRTGSTTATSATAQQDPIERAARQAERGSTARHCTAGSAEADDAHRESGEFNFTVAHFRR